MTALSLTKRLVKGLPLTATEHDQNLTDIETEVNALQTAVGTPEGSDLYTRVAAAESDIDDLESDMATAESDIDTNTAAIALNTTHRGTTSGNPHAVTKTDVGLNNVTNHEQLKKGTQWNADISSKATPVDADLILSEDSADSYVKKKSTWTQIKAFLKTYWDTLYHPLTTVGIADDNLVEIDDEDAASGDYCKLTANGIEGRSASEVRSDINVEDGATADQTGAEIKAAYEAEDNTNAFTDADHSKLDAIEASADVTDAVNVASSIHGVAGKATPIDADEVGLIDSAASNVLKVLTWANLKATLKTYFDTLYNLYVLENHASNHTDGTDDIQSATAGQKGLMTSTYASKLDGIEASADVTDAVNVASSIHGVAAKDTPVDADEIAGIDTENSNVLKKHTWTNIKAFLKTYFDTLYILKSIGTGKGDIIGFSASGTPVRLGVGTDGYVLKADSGETSGLKWSASGGGTALEYVKVSDVKAYNVNGGTFTLGAWRTRDINTEDSDASGICSISSNQITLEAGTYICNIVVPFYDTDNTLARLYNITDSEETLLGQTGYGVAVISNQTIFGKFTIAVQTTFEIQHYSIATKADIGFGAYSAVSGIDSVYTIAEFWRVTT